jgi:hypothetical protein
MISRTLVLLIDSDRVEMEAVSSYLPGPNFETIEAAEGLSGLREFFNVHPEFVVDFSVRETTV